MKLRATRGLEEETGRGKEERSRAKVVFGSIESRGPGTSESKSQLDKKGNQYDVE